jgi:hypothetical protein
MKRRLDISVSFAANGQLSKVPAVEDVGPLPAFRADPHHVQGFFDL